MERLRAVVPGADGDRLAVEERGHVMGMDARQVEGHDAGPVVDRGRAIDLDVRHVLLKRLERVSGQCPLVGANMVHADRGQVIERGAEADGGGDVRRAGLEFPGHVVEGRAAKVDLADHLAAAHERRHLLEQLAPRPERARTGRAEHLVAGEDIEVAAKVNDIDGGMRHRLRAVDEHERAGGLRLGDHLLDGVDGADAVRDVRERDELGPRPQEHLEALLVEPPIVVDGHELQVGVLLLAEQLPRDEVGMMLELGQDDGVGLAQVATTPAVGDKVDRLGRVAHEDDLVVVGRADETGGGDASGLVGGGRLFAGGVDAAVDVGRVATVVVVDRVDHGARLERGRRAVEIRQATAAEVALEDGEVGADELRIDGRHVSGPQLARRVRASRRPPPR